MGQYHHPVCIEAEEGLNPAGMDSGLKEGEQIVTTGQVKLVNGGQVKVDNSQALMPPAVRPYQ